MNGIQQVSHHVEIQLLGARNFSIGQANERMRQNSNHKERATIKSPVKLPSIRIWYLSDFVSIIRISLEPIHIRCIYARFILLEMFTIPLTQWIDRKT